MRILRNTHFTLKPVNLIFETRLDIPEINRRVGEISNIHDIIEHLRKYTAMGGYCRGGKLTLFRFSVSARFLLMTRPFRAYMIRKGERTIISGNFKFALSAKILACVWLLNDFVRLIEKLSQPIPKNFAGHIVSISLLPIILARTVWKDKVHQQKVMDYMRNELDAEILNDG